MLNEIFWSRVGYPAMLIWTESRIDLTLPIAWKERLGSFELEERIDLQTATQEVVTGTICGPVQIKVEGFRTIYSEVLFLELEPDNGEYEPLVGYIVLE